MILTRRVALDGRQMDQIDERIAIQGIEFNGGRDTISAESLYGGTGSRVSNRHRDSLDITIRFGLMLERGREAERARLLEAVNGWAAAGGWLTTNLKPDRRIRVSCASLPGDGEVIDWTKDYAIVLRAYGCPWWQEETGTSASASGANATLQATLTINGYMTAPIDAEYRNTSGSAITSLTIGAGTSASAPESRIQLESLGLASGETLVIDHPDEGDRSWLRIRIRTASGVYRSAYSCRTPESSDDLTASPGRKLVWVSGNGGGTLTANCRGRYW